MGSRMSGTSRSAAAHEYDPASTGLGQERPLVWGRRFLPSSHNHLRTTGLWLIHRISDRPLGARQLLARCDGLSSSVLYERLRELAAAALVSQDADAAYGLTDLGRTLGEALEPLDAWSRRWSRTVARRR